MVSDQTPEDDLRAQIGVIVDQVKRAILVVASDAPTGAAVSIDRVVLELQAVVTKSAGLKAKFNLFGLDLGAQAQHSRADTQLITLAFTPADDAAVEFGTAKISQELVAAFRAVRDSVADAAARPPRFALESSSVQLKFQVDNDGTLTLLATGEANQTIAQTVTLGIGPARS